MTESQTNEELDNNDGIETLSADGLSRREAMLGELVETMHGHHRAKRRRRQAVGSALGLVLVVSVLAVVWSNVTRPGPSGGSSARDATPQITPETQHAAIVETDASTIDRWVVQPRSRASTVIVTTREHSSVTRIDDDQLLDALAGIDPGAGVMQIGGRTILTGLTSPDGTVAPPEEPTSMETEDQIVPRHQATT